MHSLYSALAYHNLGMNVIPIVPFSKQPMIEWKRFQAEKTTVEMTHDWFAPLPYAGIAAILGLVSNLCAIDVDGRDAHNVLVAKLGYIPSAPTSISGSGKPSRYHLLFKHPPFQTTAKATPWHPHLEIRGYRGLIILPPSIHPSGNRYTWAEGRSLWDMPLPPLPDLIITEWEEISKRKALVKQAHHRQVRQLHIPRINGISRATKAFLRGEHADGPHWNDRLFQASCDLAGNGILLEEAMPLLLAGAHPQEESDANKAHSTITSAYSEDRLPGREYARQASPAENPTHSWESCGIIVNEFHHPRRRYPTPLHSREGLRSHQKFPC